MSSITDPAQLLAYAENYEVKFKAAVGKHSDPNDSGLIRLLAEMEREVSRLRAAQAAGALTFTSRDTALRFHQYVTAASILHLEVGKNLDEKDRVYFPRFVSRIMLGMVDAIPAAVD
jgi:hypothetical protein